MKNYKNYNQISIGFIALALAVFGIILITIPKTASAYYTKGYYTISESDYTTTNNNTGGNGTQNGYNENANPILTRINPSSVVRYSAKELHVYGDYFTPNSVVKINGANKPTSFVDQNHLIAHLSSADTANLGDQVVTVVNSKTGAQSNARLLKVVNATNTVAKKTTTTVKKATLVPANTTTTTVGPDQVVIIADRGTQLYYLDESIESDEVYNTENRTLTANSFFSTGGFMPTTFLQWIVLFILVLLCVYLWRKIYVTDAERNTPLKHP